jgi:molybdenum cofactor cytidylyltransferase
MGSPKQLLDVGGKPLLVRAIEAALASQVWPAVVVLGAYADRIRPLLARFPVLAVENPAWAEGMASSIRTGVAALRQFSRSLDGAVLALCDQPAFSGEAIDRLIAARRETGRSIAAARYSGHNGSPALFLKEHFPALLALTGEEGARSLLGGPPGAIAAVDMPELALDLDTPGDLAGL